MGDTCPVNASLAAEKRAAYKHFLRGGNATVAPGYEYLASTETWREWGKQGAAAIATYVREFGKRDGG